MGNSVGFSTDGIPDQGWRIYFSSLFLIIGSGLFVIARCMVRIKTRQLGADDYVVVASLAFSIVLTVSMQLAVAHGYGEHKADIPPAQLHRALFWFFVEQIQYKMVICLNKVSAVLLYKRIFVPKHFQIQCWTVLSIVIIWTVASLAATIFQCVPVEGAWNSKVPATCIDTSMFWMSYAVTNILTDAIVLALPLPEVFKLHLNLKQKISLCGVMMLGSFVVLCSIMRIFAVIHDDRSKDTTWDFVPRNVWSLVETNAGIVCACLPVLKAPFLRGLSFMLRSTHLSTDQYPHGSAHELRYASRQHGRSNDGHQRTQRMPWDPACEDRASDEVQIIGGTEVKELQGSKEVGLGKDTKQIWVTKDVRQVQDDV